MAGDQPTESKGSSSSLLQKAKRTLSARSSTTLKAVWPSSNNTSASNSGTCTPHKQKPYSIAPTSHRENTALHALLDSLPTLPTFHAPSLPSVFFSSSSSSPFNSFSSSSSSNTPRNLTDDEGEPKGDLAPPPPPVPDPISDPLKRLSGPVLTLGGYRGSILRDAKTGKRVWIPIKVGLGMRKVDLQLGLEDEDELRSTETIVPGRQLMQVGPIDLGKRLKDKLKSLSSPSLPAPSGPAPSPSPSPSSLPHPAPLRYINHGYDWRLSLSLSSLSLLHRLEALKRESAARGEGKDGKGEGTTVIAHSMGGLVTLHALARASDPTVFKGVVFAGTPFMGCVNVLSPLRYGDGVLLNRQICSPTAVFSMRSSFYFLPSPGLCFEDPLGNPLPIDFFDPRSWDTYGLSPVALGLFGGGGGGGGRREEKARSSSAGLGLGGGGLGEGNLGEGGLGMGEKVREGIEEVLRGVELDGGGEDSEGRRVEKEKEGEVEVNVGLATAPAAEEGAAGPKAPEMDRLASHSHSSSSQSSDEARPPTTTSSPSPSSEEEDDDGEGEGEKPSLPELDKVLSASDQTLATYLTRTLQRVKEFHADLISLYDPLKAQAGLYPPLVLLTSKKTPTVRGVMVESRESIREVGYEELLWDEGDGIVLHSSASTLPGGPSRWTKHLKGEVESNYGHVSLVGDVDSIRKCLVKLYDE